MTPEARQTLAETITPVGDDTGDVERGSWEGLNAVRICASNPRFDGAAWAPWEGNGPCQDCGARNIVWTTSPETWQRVMGTAGGLLCIGCFVRRACDAGVVAAWELSADEVTR